MESEDPQPNHVPLLDMSAIPRDIMLLGKRLADTKYQIDMLGKVGWGELTANLHGLEASGEWNGPDDALTFFSKILPFAILPSQTEPLGIFQVPTERVIGRSWRWWPEHLSGSSEEKLREHLAGPGAADSTSYYFISALALLLAVEGQSRVNYCRQRHIPLIAARVTYLSYPPADRLKIYHMTKGKNRQSWVVLNDRYLQAIQWPRITLPALSSYGVHSTSWPLSFPPAERYLKPLRPSTSGRFCCSLRGFTGAAGADSGGERSAAAGIKAGENGAERYGYCQYLASQRHGHVLFPAVAGGSGRHRR